MEGIRFLVDAEGSKTAVVIDLDIYGDLIEDLLDAAVSRERAGEEDIPWEDVRAEIVGDLRERACEDASVSGRAEVARPS